MNNSELLGPQASKGGWVQAVRSEELGSKRPLKWSHSGNAIVLYRKLDGAPVAVEDRCPHRWAPLSDGHIDGDNIVCPYHGFKFCPRGNLVTSSGVSNTPGVSCAKVYPTVERNKAIWIWLGNCESEFMVHATS